MNETPSFTTPEANNFSRRLDPSKPGNIIEQMYWVNPEVRNEEMFDRFQELAPGYMKVHAANSDMIMMGPEAPVNHQRWINTQYDASSWMIMLRATPWTEFTHASWSENTLEALITEHGIQIWEAAKIPLAGLDLQANQMVADIISSDGDRGLLIPTPDQSKIISICLPAWTVTIYERGQALPAAWMARKPVIYLYPKTTTDISVWVELSSATMIAEYPKTLNGKWEVTASPRGGLKDIRTGKKYSYLFWEAEMNNSFALNYDNAHCVSSSDIESYLEASLKTLWLNTKEMNDFIVYWLPILESNPYSIIEWKTDEYTQRAKLNISPKPDSLIRVFMVFKRSESQVQTWNPKLKRSRRKGYSVVEWWGTNLDENSIK